MQAIAANHATTHGAAKAGTKSRATTGTSLPDFAALLGMASADSAAGQAVPAATDTGRQAVPGVGSPGAPGAAPQKETGAAPADTSEKDPAALDASATAAALAGLGLGAAAAKTAGDATAATAADGKRGQPQPTVFGKTGGAATTGKAVGQAGTGGGQKAREVKAWNVSELNLQLKSAIKSVINTSMTGGTESDKAGKPQTASFQTQVKSDKIEAEGTQNLMQAAGGGKGRSGHTQGEALKLGGAQKPAAPAAQNAGQSWQGTSEKILGESVAALQEAKPEAALARVAAEAPAAIASKPAEEQPAQPEDAAASAATPLVWSPKPVADETGTSRIPTLNEQVRQVADYLADRTEGVVRMNDQGMDANLKLYPPDLGGVRVQLNVQSDGSAQAQFIVERAETAQLLQQHMRSFQQGMESHGIAVGSVKVTVQPVTVQPASSGAGSGWQQQESMKNFRGRDSGDSPLGERGGQNARRQGRNEQQSFDG